MTGDPTVGDVKATDLLTVEGRRARSRYLGGTCGLAGDDLEAFCDRMELLWRRQVLRDDRELEAQEQAQDDTRRGMLRRADAIVAEVLDQLRPLEDAAA